MTEDGRTAYVSRLTMASTWWLWVHSARLRRIILLDPPKPSGRFWAALLKFRGLRWSVADFFAGHLKTADGEAVFLAAARRANPAAFVAARRAVSSGLLRDLNAQFGRNTLQLFIARHQVEAIHTWMAQMLVARSLSDSASPLVLLSRPWRFDPGILTEAAEGIRVQFFSDPVAEYRDLIRLATSSLLKVVWHLTRPRGAALPPGARSRPGLLMMQAETLRSGRELRNQLHCYEREGTGEPFETYVVAAGRAGRFDNDPDFQVPGVTVLSMASLGPARSEHLRHPTLVRLRGVRRRILSVCWRPSQRASRVLLTQVWFLIFDAELVAALALKHQIRVFLSKEPHGPWADAMQLTAPDIGVSTVVMQYSNMPTHAPAMLSTADTYVLFSRAYESVFKTDDISPQAFVENGYLYGGLAAVVGLRASAQRRRLEDAGARFIVAYFDETLQEGRWGLVSKGDHLGELQTLAREVIASNDMGLIVKSQFVRNSPSRLYPDDPILLEAIATGRYFELCEGVHRNDVYPTEAALAADICIGHKFGATAVLEAAVAGSRGVLVDVYGMSTERDSLYAKSRIQFGSMESVLAAIRSFRAGNADWADLGDWSPILPALVGNDPDGAIVRTQELIRKWMASA